MKMSIGKTKMLDEVRRSKGHNIVVEILIFIVLEVLALLLQGAVLAVPTMNFYMNNDEYSAAVNGFSNGMISQQELITRVQNISIPERVILISLYATVVVTLTCILYCRFIEKRPLSTMGFRKNKAVAEYAVGAAVGAGLFSLAVGISFVAGALKFDGVTQNIPWGYIGLFFGGFLLQGMSEEVLCRGYFMMSMSRRSNAVVAAVVSSVAFALLHMMNNGISVLAFINLFLFGLFAALYMLKRGNIWGVCGVHSLWNFVQGNFYGVSVSGISKLSTILNISSVKTKSLINGGDFGLEGGLAVTIVYTIGIIIILCMKTKKFEESEEAAEI